MSCFQNFEETGFVKQREKGNKTFCFTFWVFGFFNFYFWELFCKEHILKEKNTFQSASAFLVHTHTDP